MANQPVSQETVTEDLLCARARDAVFLKQHGEDSPGVRKGSPGWAGVLLGGRFPLRVLLQMKV